MEKNIIIAGFGGQGVLLCGKILAKIFMLNNKKVTWYPCYGSEMRGGAVNCEIVVSDEEVTSVHKKQTDILLTLNEISFKKLSPNVKKDGIIIANSSMIKNTSLNKAIRLIKAPISDMALSLGNIKTTNIIALGVLSKLFDNIDFSGISNIIKDLFPKEKSMLANLNIEAFMLGCKFKPEAI